jgi:hypothetical protein
MQQYIAQQRDSFLKGIPPPDFPGGVGESEFANRANAGDVQSEAGKLAMGLTPLESSGQSEKQKAFTGNINKVLGF